MENSPQPTSHIRRLLPSEWDRRPSWEPARRAAEQFSLAPAEGERAGVRGKSCTANDQRHVPHLHATPHPDPLLFGRGEGSRRRDVVPARRAAEQFSFALAEGERAGARGKSGTVIDSRHVPHPHATPHPDPLPFRRGEGNRRRDAVHPMHLAARTRLAWLCFLGGQGSRFEVPPVPIA